MHDPETLRTMPLNELWALAWAVMHEGAVPPWGARGRSDVRSAAEGGCAK